LIAGKKTRQTRGYVDQVAAQIILQNYLDSRAQQKAAGGFFTTNLGSFSKYAATGSFILQRGLSLQLAHAAHRLKRTV
jgi:hypothetical protein